MGYSGKRSRAVPLLAGVTALGLLAAACGGGSKKSGSNQASATTSTSEATQTSDTTASTDTTIAGATPTTVAGGVTGTTAKSSSSGGSTSKTTVKKATTATTRGLATGSGPTGGISNVTAAPTTAASKDITPGGTLTVLKAGEIAGFDPPRVTNSGSNDGPANSAVYDMLLYSQGGSVKPKVADSLTSTDALVWTLKIHPNIKFTDGTPYDAAAVKFNWARIADPANSAIRASYAQLIQSMDVVDAVTLKITLKAKNALFPGAAANIPYVGSPTAIQARGADYNSNPVGAGPFVLKNWTRDSTLTVTRNPNYWNAPQPYLDQIVFKVVIDESQRMNTLKTGDANLSFISTAQDAQQTQNDGSVPYSVALNGGSVLNFNNTKPPFDDIRARQAVAMAIDPKAYVKVVNNNGVDPVDSVFRHNSPFFDASIVQMGYDPVKAQQLFDQVAAANGGTLKFTISTFPATNYQVAAQYLQGILNGYKNVQVSVVTESSQAHQTSCNTRAFVGICHTSIPFDDPDPAWVNQLLCNAPVNPTGWCDAKFDSDIADNRVTLDANQRINDIKDAQKEFYGQVPAFFIERFNSWWSGAPAIQDFELVNDGLFLVDRMWIKK